MLPRTVQRHTPLRVPLTILYPGIDPAYLPIAETLARTLEHRVGAYPEVVADTTLMPTRSSPLPQSYRDHTLIVLGNLGTNRAILPLYARYLCATDATYPGGDGYDLRTIVNPYGTRSNVILAGGSTLRGVTRAVERLSVRIANQQDEDIPFLLEVELAPDLARALAQWPDAPLDAPIPTVEDSMRKTHALT